MRAYIDGVLSSPQDTFIPEDLWFAGINCTDNTTVSVDCVCLSGMICESTLNKDKDKFSCRWKGVMFTYIDEDGKEIETEDFTVKEFVEFIKERKMKLSNASAYFDTDVEVRFTSIKLVDDESNAELDLKDTEDIEFIAE